MNNGMATFLDARAPIMREIESIFLPQTWRFFIPTFSPMQEAEIVLGDLFDESNNFSQFELEVRNYTDICNLKGTQAIQCWGRIG